MAAADFPNVLDQDRNTETVTVRIELDQDAGNHCYITYAAADPTTKQNIQSMVTNSADILAKGSNPYASEKFLMAEKELGLKRHSPKDEEGRVLPAYRAIYHPSNYIQHSETCEYWQEGKPAALFGVHVFTKAINGLLARDIFPIKSDTREFLAEPEKQIFIKQYNDYYHTPKLV